MILYIDTLFDDQESDLKTLDNEIEDWLKYSSSLDDSPRKNPNFLKSMQNYMYSKIGGICLWGQIGNLSIYEIYEMPESNYNQDIKKSSAFLKDENNNYQLNLDSYTYIEISLCTNTHKVINFIYSIPIYPLIGEELAIGKII